MPLLPRSRAAWRDLAAPPRLACVLAGGLVLACAASPAVESQCPDATFDPRAPLAVLEAQREAWNRGDLEAYMDGYLRSESLVFTSGAQVRRGWQVTHDRYLARYGGSSEGMGQLAFEILEVQALGDEAAVVLGRWELRETPQAGAGVFSVVLLRTPEGWKVVHDHTSADPD